MPSKSVVDIMSQELPSTIRFRATPAGAGLLVGTQFGGDDPWMTLSIIGAATHKSTKEMLRNARRYFMKFSTMTLQNREDEEEVPVVHDFCSLHPGEKICIRFSTFSCLDLHSRPPQAKKTGRRRILTTFPLLRSDVSLEDPSERTQVAWEVLEHGLDLHTTPPWSREYHRRRDLY